MNWLNEVWEFPMIFLAWISFNLIILTNGKIRWINAIAMWLELTDKTVIDLIDKEDDLGSD